MLLIDEKIAILQAIQKAIYLTENETIIESWKSIGLPESCTYEMYLSVASYDLYFNYILITFSNHMLDS